MRMRGNTGEWVDVEVLVCLQGGEPEWMDNFTFGPAFLVLLYSLVVRRPVPSSVMLSEAFIQFDKVVMSYDKGKKHEEKVEEALVGAADALKRDHWLETVVSPLGLPQREGSKDMKDALKRGQDSWREGVKIVRPASNSAHDLFAAVGLVD